MSCRRAVGNVLVISIRCFDARTSYISLSIAVNCHFGEGCMLGYVESGLIVEAPVWVGCVMLVSRFLRQQVFDAQRWKK